MICSTVKNWYRILLMGKDELLTCFYEWQVGKPKSGKWARNLSYELYRIGLRHFCLTEMGRIRKIYV